MQSTRKLHCVLYANTVIILWRVQSQSFGILYIRIILCIVGFMSPSVRAAAAVATLTYVGHILR